MDKLRCVVERITFSNDDNGYTVLRVRVKGYDDLVTVVGNLAAVCVGSVLSLSGQWKLDKKYGRQFIASNWEETLPATVTGIEKYIASGLIHGIGRKYAKLIVSRFGADTIRVIEETPERLLDVGGIGQKRVNAIKKAWHEHREVKNIMIFLQEHKVSTALGVKIYKTYGNESINIIRQNPFKLADDIFGVGFKTADTIAMNMGFDKEGYYRCRSGLFYVLNDFAGGLKRRPYRADPT